MSDEIKTFLGSLAEGKTAEAKELIENILYTKAGSILEQYKTHVAGSLLTVEEVLEDEPSDDTESE